jgi:hypothetical protein
MLHGTVIAMKFSTEKVLSPILEWFRQSDVVRARTAAFILAIIWLTVPQYQPPTLRYIDQTLNPPPILQSPFEKTVAIIRFNHAYRERLPLLRKYEPFFHTVQYIGALRLYPSF